MCTPLSGEARAPTTRTRAATTPLGFRRCAGWAVATSRMGRCRRAPCANHGAPSPPSTAWATASAASVPLARARSGTRFTAPSCLMQSPLRLNLLLHQRQLQPPFPTRTQAREPVAPTRLLPLREHILQSRRNTRPRPTISLRALAILRTTTRLPTPRRRRTRRRRQKRSDVATTQPYSVAGVALPTSPTSRPTATLSDTLDG
jgi:hypothetical protein